MQARAGLYVPSENSECLPSHHRAPWESNGIRLNLRPRSKCNRQRWVADNGDSAFYGNEGVLIRHTVGGQVLDVNYWLLQKGSGVNLNAPTIIGKHAILWVVEYLDGSVMKPPCWPPQHTAADPAHFDKLKREGGVDQVWLIKKRSGERFVQHNLSDGTYKRYTLSADWFELCGSGNWKLQGGSYSEENDGQPHARGRLVGDAVNFKIEVHVSGMWCRPDACKKAPVIELERSRKKKIC